MAAPAGRPMLRRVIHRAVQVVRGWRVRRRVQREAGGRVLTRVMHTLRLVVVCAQSQPVSRQSLRRGHCGVEH
eukprot:4826061-Pyramimonas_sp.AAC.1